MSSPGATAPERRRACTARLGTRIAAAIGALSIGMTTP
jgi:hypothetical protein